MKGVLFAAGLAALLCSACSVMPVTRSVEYVSPEGQPAGYYPGLGTTSQFKSELAAYLAKNQAGIAEVQNRITQIREGKRTGGCIGEDKYTCVATLAQKLAITDDVASKDLNLFADARYDVNGRPVSGQRVMLDGYIPNYQDVGHRSARVIIVLGSNGTVASAEAIPLKGTPSAHTQEEYDTTSVYEIVAAMSAKQCPSLSKSDVARWIENTVKPSMRKAPEDTKEYKESKKQLAEESIHYYHSYESPRIAYCGRTFQFTDATFVAQEGFSREHYFVPTVKIQ